MIVINNLTKSYNNNVILQKINLDLSDKCIYFLMGKNGSGKTTLIKCLLGLEKYEGVISYGGKQLQLVRDEIFVIYDDIPLYDELNGFQNIKLMIENFSLYDVNSILELKLLSKKN